ncbi:hypothetical protein SDC9_98822 [bioreactor metagenome]|uniref:Uncharacterized protein n=1 Tax=bioreactor metagenome TaxID=1076179 RepID=A0A645AFV9_9ZZZZ
MGEQDWLIDSNAERGSLCEGDVVGALVRNRNCHGVHSAKRHRHNLHREGEFRFLIACKSAQIRRAEFINECNVRIITGHVHADIVRSSAANVLYRQIDVHRVSALQRIRCNRAGGYDQHRLGRGNTATSAGGRTTVVGWGCIHLAVGDRHIRRDVLFNCIAAQIRPLDLNHDGIAAVLPIRG